MFRALERYLSRPSVFQSVTYTTGFQSSYFFPATFQVYSVYSSRVSKTVAHICAFLKSTWHTVRSESISVLLRLLFSFFFSYLNLSFFHWVKGLSWKGCQVKLSSAYVFSGLLRNHLLDNFFYNNFFVRYDSLGRTLRHVSLSFQSPFFFQIFSFSHVWNVRQTFQQSWQCRCRIPLSLCNRLYYFWGHVYKMTDLEYRSI